MEKILFVINPTAGGGRTEHLIPTINDIMKTKDIEYDMVKTKKPKDGIKIARESLKKGYKKIVAVGGDGTVNEVAFGILEHGKGTLGIIPSGTGNDLARTLKISFSLEEAINSIINGHEDNIDVGVVNNNLFLNIASIGFDAEVVITTNKIKKRIKSGIAYLIGLFITLFRFKNIEVELEVDQTSKKMNVFLIAVGNGKYYGGGINILPMANVEDSYFHVLVVKGISKFRLLLLLPTIINGTHINQKKHVEVFKAKKIKVKTQKNSYLNIDGDIEDLENEVVFAMYKKKLSVITNN